MSLLQEWSTALVHLWKDELGFPRIPLTFLKMNALLCFLLLQARISKDIGREEEARNASQRIEGIESSIGMFQSEAWQSNIHFPTIRGLYVKPSSYSAT